jgi:hypothetical protein
MVRWLRTNRPEIYRRLTSSDVPVELQEIMLNALSVDDYRRLPVWDKHAKTVQTDVLVITPQFSPDMIKDVIALRSQRPGIHCTLLMGPMWWGQRELTTKYFDEIIEYGNEGIVGIIERLNVISARSTIIRGARTYLDVVAKLFCPGRLIFRAEELTCAIPGYDPQSESFICERYLFEHASASYHYWGDEATNSLRDLMDIRGQIENIRSACVEELGPHQNLPKLSATDGAMHAVFAGDVIIIDGEPEHLDKWQQMCTQGVHVHYYNPRPGWQRSKQAVPYLALNKQTPFFHIEKAVDFERALVEFTQYDWAYGHFERIRCETNPGFNNVAGNLIYTFIQARLPLIISPIAGSPFISRIVDEFDAGLSIDIVEFSTIDTRLKDALTEDLPERLQRLNDAMSFKRKSLADLVLPTSEH